MVVARDHGGDLVLPHVISCLLCDFVRYQSTRSDLAGTYAHNQCRVYSR